MKPGHCLVPLPTQIFLYLAAIPIFQGPLRDWHTSNLNPSPHCYPEPNFNVVIAVRAGPKPNYTNLSPYHTLPFSPSLLPIPPSLPCLTMPKGCKAGGSMRLGYDTPRQGDPDPLAYLQ